MDNLAIFKHMWLKNVSRLWAIVTLKIGAFRILLLVVFNIFNLSDKKLLHRHKFRRDCKFRFKYMLKD